MSGLWSTEERKAGVALQVTGPGRAARYDRRKPSPPTVSVIVPTYNERENIVILVDRLTSVLADFDYEILVVDDDSPDGTWRVVEDRTATDRRVRVLRRVGRRGLSSAVIDGMAAADGRVLAVMDADLQHDEAALPAIISAVLDDDVDICLGSREAVGGGYGRFGRHRRIISWLGAQLARRLLGVKVGDPMSGYFAVSRQRFEAVQSTVNPRGFKVLLELLARGPRPVVSEVGYQFRSRTRGETKLGARIILSFLVTLVELTLSRSISSRFIAYGSVALVALSLRLSVEGLLQLSGLPFSGSLAAAEIAILFEFGAHSRYAFSGYPAAGRSTAARLLRFHLVGWYGVVTLVGVATMLDRLLARSDSTLEVGLALAASALAVIATIVAGYTLNTSLTWAEASGATISDPYRSLVSSADR